MSNILNDTTICIFFRDDNFERRRNLKAVVTYYFERIDNIIVFYEHTYNIDDSLVQFLQGKCTLILSRGRNDTWNKSIGYNQCAKLAKTPILCFNDTDVVVEIEQLRATQDYLLKNNNTGIIYPFDGRFLCVDKALKNQALDILDDHLTYDIIQDFKQFEPKTRNINDSTEHVFVGHNNSPGGIAMMRKDNFLKFGGYNPKFLGWGYEDSEILSRARILGYKNGRASTMPCWHMDHTDESSSPKETQLYHEQNRLECSHVESLNREQLERYIKTWSV